MGTKRISQITSMLPNLVARVRAPVSMKMLVAFLGVALMVIALGVLGLVTLGAANHRTARLLVNQERFPAL
ncbi:MAG: hypothetical protein GY952_10420 [Rhodobacteraceae bacterium]|nr:hypothetical protein [Paracoccaceae bacterium]